MKPHGRAQSLNENRTPKINKSSNTQKKKDLKEINPPTGPTLISVKQSQHLPKISKLGRSNSSVKKINSISRR